MSDKLIAAAKAAFLETEHGGGCSVSPKDFTSPTSGYMVGGWASECKLKASKGRTVAELEAEFIDWFIDYVNSANIVASGLHLPTYVGTWVEDGDIVFDVAVCIEDKAEALQTAKDLGERAIYDVSKKETLYV
jgi:hypothetical protein